MARKRAALAADLGLEPGTSLPVVIERGFLRGAWAGWGPSDDRLTEVVSSRLLK